jgi:hypothetical protein
LVRSKRQKVICLYHRQLQQAKFICKSWSLLVSELHTYFVEKKEVHRICCRSHSRGSASFAVSERPQLVCPKANLFGRPLQHCI